MNAADYDRFAEFKGNTDKTSWRPVIVERAAADDSQFGLRSDFPWLGGHVLVFTNKAYVALQSILEESGTLLPILTIDGEELLALDSQIIDALNYEESNVEYIPGTDRIMYVKDEVFNLNCLANIEIFRLPHRGSSTYVSQKFVDLVNENALVGLSFEPW